MAVTDQQKLDFLLKKIGFTKTKTGSVVGTGAISGTGKQPFAEAIPSPLIIANSALWNESDSIPTTPPGSDTSQVKVYLAGTSGLRMTADSTSSGQRAYIAYTTYGNASSARLTNWIDTQFGASYLIKVYKGDPNSGGVALSAAGSGANDGWFFDYSAGVLNFNDTSVPSGVTDTNIYIVGYRYIGQTGAPTSGISTFSYLDLTVERNLDVGIQGGISTFTGNINANGDIVGDNATAITGILRISGQSAATMAVQNVHYVSRGTDPYTTSYLHLNDQNVPTHGSGGNFTTLASISGLNLVFDTNNNDNNGLVIGSGSTNTSLMTTHMVVSNAGNVGIGSTIPVGKLDVNGRSELDNVNIAETLNVVGVSTFISNINADGDLDVDGHTNLDNVSISGVTTGTTINATTFVGNGDFVELDVDGHTNLDNLSVAGVTTTAGLLDINAGGQANTFKVEDLTSGRVVLAGTGGELEDSNKLTFDGTTLELTGDANFTGNVSVGGTLTYEDVKNVDAVGLITARSGIRVTSGVIEAQAGENKIPSLYADISALPSASTYHGMFAHVHSTGKGYYAHNGNWIELVNKDTSGNVALSGDLDVDGHTNLDNVSIAGVVTATTFVGNGDFVELDVDGHTNLDHVSVAGVSTFTGAIDANGDLDVDGQTTLDDVRIAGVTTITNASGTNTFKASNNGIQLYHNGLERLSTNTTGIDVNGILGTDQLNVSGNVSIAGVTTITQDLDVDGHTNLDNVSVAGVTTFQGVIEAPAGANKIPSYYANFTDLPSPNTYHGLFAHVHNVGRGYFAHAGSWYELVNREFNGVVGTGTERYDVGTVDVTDLNSVGVITAVSFVGDGSALTGLGATDYIITGTAATFTGGVEIDSDLSVSGISTFTDDVHIGIAATVGIGSHVHIAKEAYLGFGDDASSISGLRIKNTNINGYDRSSIMSKDLMSLQTILGPTITLNNGSYGNPTYKVLSFSETDNFFIRTTVSGTNANIIETDTAKVKLNYLGDTKLQTSGIGITVTGEADISGDLDVDGHTNLDNVSVAGVTTFSSNMEVDGDARFDGSMTLGGTAGINGQYLKTTGGGVAWASFPTMRTKSIITASAGQTIFSFSYNVGFLDVYVNGVKLSDAEFTATNGSAVILAVACFADDTVELVSFNTVSGGGGSGGSGISIEDEGSALPTASTALNFVGTGVVASGTGSTKTITIAAGIAQTAIITSNDITTDGLSATGIITASNTDFVNGNFSSGVSINGTLSVQDVSIAGVITASDIRSNSLEFKNAAGSQSYATFSNGGGSTLKWNNTDRLETKSGGVDITGTVNATAFVGDGSGLTGITGGSGATINNNADNRLITGSNSSGTLEAESTLTYTPSTDYKLELTGNDSYINVGSNATRFELRNDGNNSFLYHYGAGTYHISLAGTSNTIQFDSITQTFAQFKKNAECALYWSGTKRFETSNGGAIVTGVCTATKFVGDGSGLTGISGGGSGVTSDSFDNTYAGTQSGVSLGTNSTDNTFFGYHAGRLVNTGDGNTLIGAYSGDAITNGNKNVALGEESLPVCSGGSENVAVGNNAGNNLSSGSDNAFIGYQAGATSNGTYNVCVGAYAGANGTGDYNISLGYYSNWLGGSNTVAIGQNTLTRGSQVGSIGIGYYAGYNNTSDYSIYIGYESGNGLGTLPYSTGDHNVGIGYQSLYLITSGQNNTALGRKSGHTLTTGFNNLLLGNEAEPSSATISNEITLGNGAITKFRIPGINLVLGDNGSTLTQGHVLTIQGNGEATFSVPTGGGGGGGGGADVGITTSIAGSFNAIPSSIVTIDTYGYSTNDLVFEYTVYIKNNATSELQTQKVLASRDGTSIQFNQFAVMYTTSLLAQLSVTESSGNINLRITPEPGVSGSTDYRIKREVM